MTRAQALAAMREAVGPEGVVASPDAERYLVDHRRQYRGRTPLIVRPGSAAAVAEVVRLAAAAGLCVVPQGGNTGYCGGATPGIDEDGTGEARSVLLSLERLRRIRKVDPVNYTMTVEAGVVLAQVQAAAAEHDLLFPLSLGSEGSCQIGGNLATNAGGTAVLRYGNAREMVLGLEVVLADGRVWNGLRELRKDNAGYDLKQVFLGSEGTLGIITAAVLKLFPLPRSRETALVAVPDVEAACALLARARRETADAVTSFEYLPRFAVDLVVRHLAGVDNPLDAPGLQHYVLVELSSAARDAGLEAQLEALLATGLEDGRVLDAVVARSEEQRRRLWRLRELVPEAQRAEGGSYKHDVSVPVSELATLLREGLAGAARVAPEARPCAYGHIGDGNLHFNFLAPAGVPLAEYFAGRRGEAVSGAVLEATAALGGSVCAEHGVGRAKRPLLVRYADPLSLALMHRLKGALDPAGTLNPGKVLPAPEDQAG